MPDPPPWPERPPEAQDFDLFWLVRTLPPEPFPLESYDYGSDPRFGPPGTRWVFTLESLANRQTLPGTSQAIKAAIDRLFQKLRVKLPAAGSTSWTQDYPLAPPADPVRMPMRYVRVAVIGKLGTDESLTHTLSLRHKNKTDPDMTDAQVQAVADKVRDVFGAWFNGTGIQGLAAVRNLFSNELSYREVRAAYVELPGPGHRVTHTGGKKPHVVYEYDKANYLVRTQYSTWGTPPVGAGTQALPFEVACALSLESGRRGAANRGRVYLGGLATAALASGGRFDVTYVSGLATSFAQRVIHPINTQTDFEVVIASRYWNDSIPVNGVRVGFVPDSQRRRRRSQKEQYTLPAAIAAPA